MVTREGEMDEFHMRFLDVHERVENMLEEKRMDNGWGTFRCKTDNTRKVGRLLGYGFAFASPTNTVAPNGTRLLVSIVVVVISIFFFFSTFLLLLILSRIVFLFFFLFFFFLCFMFSSSGSRSSRG